MARKKIGILSDMLSITDTNQSVVRKTNANRSIHDFEDGLEYYSAAGARCKCLVTEDGADFYFSEMEVLSSRDFLEKYVL